MEELQLYKNQISFEIERVDKEMEIFLKKKDNGEISEFDFISGFKKNYSVKYKLERINTKSIYDIENNLFDAIWRSSFDASLAPLKPEDKANWKNNSKIFDYLGHLEVISVLYNNIYLNKDNIDKCCPENKILLENKV